MTIVTISSTSLARPEKFAPAVKHLNAMYASRRAKLSLIFDPTERQIKEHELRQIVLADRQALSKIHESFEDIGSDVVDVEIISWT